MNVEFVRLRIYNFFFRYVEFALGELHLIKTLCGVRNMANICGNAVHQRK
jgi:hypothetical protein